MEPLRTKRLTLQPWQLDEIEAAFQLWGDPKVMALLDARGGLTHEQAREKMEKEIARQNELGVSYWKTTETATGQLVGCAGLQPWQYTPDKDAWEVGFHLVPRFWGKGMATEAATAAIRYAVDVKQLAKLMAGHHPANTASKNVLEKLGFHHAGETLYPPTGLLHPYYEWRRR